MSAYITNVAVLRLSYVWVFAAPADLIVMRSERMLEAIIHCLKVAPRPDITSEVD